MLKIILHSVIIIIIAIALLGCPAVTKYPLGDLGTVPIDRNLLGIWETSDDYDVLQNRF